MKITIKADPKEIAALVLAIQEQPVKKGMTIILDGKELVATLKPRIEDPFKAITKEHIRCSKENELRKSARCDTSQT